MGGCRLRAGATAFGQVRVSNELRKRGVFVSPSGVRSVWLRRNLESFKKRLSVVVPT